MTDIKTVLTKAADQLEAQPALWKATEDAYGPNWTCIGLAILDGFGTFRAGAETEGACRLVADHLGLPDHGFAIGSTADPEFFRLANWNDRPETTLEDAVRALRETAALLP